MVSLFQPTGARIWVRGPVDSRTRYRCREGVAWPLDRDDTTERTHQYSQNSWMFGPQPQCQCCQSCPASVPAVCFPKWAKPALHGPCSRGCPDGQHALRGAGRLTSVPSNNADRKLDRWAELACRRAGPRRFGSSAPASSASVYLVATRRTCYLLPRLRMRTPARRSGDARCVALARALEANLTAFHVALSAGHRRGIAW